ncbi:hypothetical protein ACE38V_07305 [Cytobacillus sp. Hz8]|uniref:hypothetical protein n=1 Tax=Cytobacillus sp. Hz8 TaxID=3347168 RepID=UPI0035DA476A
MNSANVIQSLIKQDGSSIKKAISLQPGQIIHGKVIKLFPNQTAEIQVGSQKMVAQLEVPLAANDRYWFQVQPGEGKIHLKVLLNQALGDNGKILNIDGLLKQLGLAASKENIELVQFFIKEQLPLTKETLSTANEWFLQLESDRDGLEALKQMITRNLPLSKNVFYSMLAAVKDDSMNSLVTNLQDLLENDQLSSDSAKKLFATLTMLQSPISTEGKDKVVSQMMMSLLSPNYEKSETTIQLLQKLGWISMDKIKENQNQEIIKDGQLTSNRNNQSQTVPYQINLTEKNNENQHELITAFQEKENILSRNSLHQSLNVLAETLTNMIDKKDYLSENIKPVIHSFISDEHLSDMQKQNIMRNVINLLEHLQDENTGNHAFQSLLKAINGIKDGKGLHLSFSEREILTAISTLIDRDISQLSEGPFVANKLKQLIKVIGYDYEHDAIQFMNNGQISKDAQDFGSLKPLLIKYLNEDPPQMVKEAAEQLLNKITGIQTLSQEMGPVQQFVVQLPLRILDQSLDITMQWSGRKNSDGKIDPNYCRVLFYLDLSALKETIVDVKIQNRIMNVSVINDHEDIKIVAAPLINHLKENLASFNYHLSSISFVQTKNMANHVSAKTFDSLSRIKQYTGVDIRI